jgi:hypothetical protein
MFRVFVVKARPGLHAWQSPHPIIALVVSSRFLGVVLPSCLVARVFVVGQRAGVIDWRQGRKPSRNVLTKSNFVMAAGA